MESSENRAYYRERAQTARESAMRALEPGVRRVHLEMAERYAARARAPESVTGPIRAAINEG